MDVLFFIAKYQHVVLTGVLAIKQQLQRYIIVYNALYIA